MSRLEMRCKCGEIHMWQTMDPKPSTEFDVQDLDELIRLVAIARGSLIGESLLCSADIPTTRMVALTILERKLIAAKGKVT